MKDFDKRLLELGHWHKPQGPKCEGKLPQFILDLPTDKEKPRCSGEYPFCDRSMLITYHTITNRRAEPGTVRLQCKICNRGGIVQVQKWREDLGRT